MFWGSHPLPWSLPRRQLWVTFLICWRAGRGGGEKCDAVCLPTFSLWIIQNCNNITTAICRCREAGSGSNSGVLATTARFHAGVALARSQNNAELRRHNQTSNKDVEPLHNLLESWMTRRRGETRPHLLQLKHNPPFPKHLYFIHGENQTCALWFYLRGFLSPQAWACTSLKGGGKL